MAAGHAEPEMNPPASGFQTFFATARLWRDGPHLIQMNTLIIPLHIQSLCDKIEPMPEHSASGTYRVSTKIVFILLTSAVCSGQKTYDIYRAASPINIDAKLDERDWQQAPSVGDFDFPWFKEGAKEQTVAKLLWDDENLYVSWYAHDRHISASVTQRHGPVSKDDCVEIFLSPNPEKVKNYYTFEINAIGTMLNRARTDWWSGPPTWEPEGVRYRATYHGLPKKEESPQDDHWIVEAAIPLKNFARDAAHTPPRNGDRWRLNLQRLGGLTNSQASTWAPLPEGVRSFHTPEAFGYVRFVSSGPPQSTPAATHRRASSEMIQQGREIYNRSCTMCHGQDGTAGDRAPALAERRRYLRVSERDLFDAIKQGIAGTLMPASPLPDADISKMVAYIRSLRATAIDAPVEGDIAHGREIFDGKGRCSECHTLRGRGGLLGPDLSNIAAERSMRFLEESLTKARPHIPRGYQPVRVLTADGQQIRGVLKNEHNFSLQLLDTQGKLHLLSRDELREIEYEKESLMPANYDKTLSEKELKDLLAFLSRQGQRSEAEGETPRRRR
jgi:putative heme-binding domain-containing protein